MVEGANARHLVVESMRSREGRHLFVYPFAGRHVHIGLGSLLAYRIGQGNAVDVFDFDERLRFRIAVAGRHGLDGRMASADSDALLTSDNLLEDVLASLNAGELALRRFREVARISGLIFQGYPGAPKSTKQLQASSGSVLRSVSQIRRR